MLARLLRLRRRAVRPAGPVLVAQSHAGHSGYAVYEAGRQCAWGANESAAIAAYRVGKAA